MITCFSALFLEINNLKYPQDDFDTTFTGRGSRGFLPIEMLRNQSGERILLDKTTSDTTTTSSDPLQALNEHAKQHCFTVDYLDIG